MHDETTLAELRAAAERHIAALPPLCFYDHPQHGLCVLKRGETGLFAAHPELAAHGRTADELNDLFGITRAVTTAMSVGAFFGWHAEGADPSTWRYMHAHREQYGRAR